MNNTQDSYKRFYRNVKQSAVMKEFYDVIAWYSMQNYKKKKKDI